jgi:tRNA uridine 5-carbamoylmethylation protein Kti12
MSDVVIMTGPPGAGTDAVAEVLARRIAKAAIIDTDQVHGMIAVGRREIWEGDEGRNQRSLRVRNACSLASNFVAAGYRPIILDIVSADTAVEYRELLQPARVKIVLLLPSFEAVDQRNSSRTPPFDSAVLRQLYESQRRFSEFDHLLDNTNLNATAVAERLWEDLFGS